MASIKKIVVLLIFCVALSSCEKNNNVAPKNNATPASAPTPTINGSLTALINGKPWTSTQNTSVLVVDFDEDESAFIINGETTSEILALGYDIFSATTVLKTGKHEIQDNDFDPGLVYSTKTGSGGTLTQHIPYEGDLTLTAVDNTNRIVSGTFNFKAAKPGSKVAADTLEVTGGVFTNIKFTVKEI